MADANTITDTDLYPVYDSKADFLLDFEQSIETGGRQKQLEVLWRLSNTDTSAWADGDARHDD